MNKLICITILSFFSVAGSFSAHAGDGGSTPTKPIWVCGILNCDKPHDKNLR
ncbi:hypothetical protein [Pseudoalteromonas sp. OOF1S-7]|uniref:hypothetical protein n=1 Tax=Pseudoalteromonas sp. OOF1S-7 TaxID=2917757 RepID=UPI001EF46698|nr:hypothetical protein [Pseudoalteromonas sp. OOF1S-7]MCG7536087.1 hypothetical protein [Pseudoalteromonas sp. OOF1S-7]